MTLFGGIPMNKQDLIAAVAKKVGLNNTDAKKNVEAVLDLITEAVCEGNKVSLSKFGTFEVKERAARTGRNPSTGEAIEIAASRAVSFKPAAYLHDKLNGKD